MPLDGHAHLVRQGWSGKGNGLRHGAITKPVTVVQKKTLAGIGKDRDEAFPFWDHVFQAAVSSIQVKIHNSDDESVSDDTSTPAVTLQRTSTGIISNRRPVTGTPALDSESGSTTPSDSVAPRLSVMAAAKQQAARRMLYSMFYRGPVLSTEEEAAVADDLAHVAGPSTSAPSPAPAPSDPKDEKERKKSKKRKAEKIGGEDEEERRERKRRKREAKEKKATKKASKSTAAAKDTAAESDGEEADSEDGSKAARAARKAEKAERKRRKAEKRARKEEKRKKKAERAASLEDATEEDDGDVVLAVQAETAEHAADSMEGTTKRTKDHSATSWKKKKSRIKS